MTADDKPTRASRSRRRSERWAWGLLAATALLAVLALLALYAAHGAQQDAHGARQEAHSADVSASAFGGALATANLRIEQLGGVPVHPSPGARGAPGLSGRGIVASAIVDQHLVLTYTDGTSTDVGKVVGPAGATGHAGKTGPRGTSGPRGAPGGTGAQGRGIASTAITDAGHLVVTYTDGSAADLGQVVGPQGQQGAQGQAGPSGQDGASGQAGSPPASFTFTVPGPGGLGDTTYLCTPDGSAGPGDQPHYTCQPQPQPSSSDTPARGNR